MRTTRNLLALTILLANGMPPSLADEIQTTKAVNLHYAQRVKDLGEQIQLLNSKGLITQDDTAKLMERQAQLSKTEQTVEGSGFPKGPTNDLEKAITLLNADLFHASHKANPIKSDARDKDLHDPNLVPAYNDPKLQPGSGVVDGK